ncbi:16S rRNA (guanine(527)-N(7))-methyltransferase RsmG [Candidatus Peregrinibacteria bacterium]|nr:16S rRNA (guanine(527)-N(7))-methyltransferase RsmG [Candidatus Peregrinibacteria bacterium]
MTFLPFDSFCKEAGLSLTCQKITALQQFAGIFFEKNKVINLARCGSCEEFYRKHLLDALMANQFFTIEPGMKVADLGTGGGLPGIPLAILYPKAQFTLIDSVEKKLCCVREFAEKLKLMNIKTSSKRLEVLGQDTAYREIFDLVMSRALAPLPTLLELALPLTKVGGTFIAMKGPNYESELNDAAHAMKVLQISPPEVKYYELTGEAGKRVLLIFKKLFPTPAQYPRRDGIPKKNPL